MLNKNYFICFSILWLVLTQTYAQNKQSITATLHDEDKIINIQQTIVFTNHTNDTLNQIYLYDWNNAYENKNTALAKRFAEEFDKSLHFANDEQRGNTKIINIIDKNFRPLTWERLDVDDIIKVQLKHPVYPNQSYSLNATYAIKLPSSEFTGYGYDKNSGRIKLEYWYLSPIPYDGHWKLYSNMNINDMYVEKSDYSVSFNYPEKYKLTSNADSIAQHNVNNYLHTQLWYTNNKYLTLYLEPIKSFKTVETDHFTFTSNIEPKNLSELVSYVSIDKVSLFLNKYLNPNGKAHVLISESDYKKNPIYGLNQLPSFLRPFQDDFLYELRILKTTLNNYLLQTIEADPRKNKWVFDAIEAYLLIKYVEEYYPDMKLAGNFSKTWGLKSFHAAQMGFNEQYVMYYMLMARRHIDQPLTTSRDSLIKFNNNIASKYKAGIGLNYLDYYLGYQASKKVIEQFLNGEDTSEAHFRSLIKNNANRNVDWFFDTYLGTNKKIDFKITKVKEDLDSIEVTIKNIRHTNVPISLFTFREGKMVKKYWVPDIINTETVKIPNNSEDKFVLNYDKLIPEYNQRNNYKKLNPFIFNKPLQLRLLQDAEDPEYNQVFLMPEVAYNYYDGIILGAKFYNKTLINRPFVYIVKPQYATKSNDLVGSALLSYRHFRDNKKLYLISYGIGGAYYHYGQDLVYKELTPSVSLTFRPSDYRSNKRKIINFRAVNIERERDTLVVLDSPSYTVFNARYLDYNNDILNYKSWFFDAQVGSGFSKVAFNYEYRKLYDSNRQLNVRVFGGKFLYNNTNTDYFSFALDRPTDYLFDYGYLGRSESTGLFSQQIIIAEGGFKSKLNPAYANDWMLTTNVSTSIYRWIEAYGDVGLVKNKNVPTQFMYDSGIRLNLVTDYFELYLPVYSNLGWEIADPTYSSKIRFVVTLTPKALTGLFTRKWF